MGSTATTVTSVITTTLGLVVCIVLAGFHIRKCRRKRSQRQIHARNEPESDWHQRILEAELEAERVWLARRHPQAPTTEPPPAYTAVAPQRERESEHERMRTSQSLRRAMYRLPAIRSNPVITVDVDVDVDIAEPAGAHLPPYSRDDPQGGRLPPYESVVVETSVSTSAIHQGRTHAQRAEEHAGWVAGDRPPWHHSWRRHRQRTLRSILDDIELGDPYMHRTYVGDARRWSWSTSSSSSS
ncbi:hypothetical protein RBB50_005153 [Rhinocladiella similis]